MFWVLLIGSLVLYLLIAPALGLVAFSRVRGISSVQVGALRARIDSLSDEVAALRRQVAGAPPPEPEAAPEAESETEPAAEPEAGETPPQEPAAAEDAFATASGEATPEPPAETADEAPLKPVSATQARGAGLEAWLTSRGLIWLGGVTLALAGLFLAKYGYDRGWLRLGPWGRVISGFAFGIALTLGGEWLRRRPLQRAIAAIGPNYLPPALTAAGLASAFGSIYAAHALYGLLPPLVAFALLALVAFAAFALAILQGPLIAVLALLGGFATPLLVTTPEPSAWGLFPYLLALSAASLAITRYMGCWWLAWGTLLGAVLWPLFWFAAVWSPQDSPALAAYLVLLAGLFLGVRYRVETIGGEHLWPAATPDRIAWAAALATAVLTFILVRMDGYDPVSLIATFLIASLFLTVGWREAVFEGLALLAALLVLAVVAAWHLPAIADWPQFTHDYRGVGYAGAVGPVVPPQLSAFVVVLLSFGALFAAVGFLALPRVRRPALWAAVSAGVPVGLLAIAYWRVTGLGIDLAWSTAALGVAGLQLAVAAWIRRQPPHGGGAGDDLLLGIYALAGVAALGLAFAMALEQAWLTVALSLLLPATAWISARLDLTSLRPVAVTVAGVVLVRLVANYNVLDYPLGSLPGLNWILYGYGVPALAFWWASREFRRQADDGLVRLLEGGALVLAWLLVTLEIRSFVVGDLASRSYDLAEQALQGVAWLAMAYGCLRAYRVGGREVLLWGWRLLAGLAALHSAFFLVLANNPLWSGEAVGSLPILNLLLLAYLLPAGFALAFAWELRRSGQRAAAMAAAIYALLLVFTWLSLEVRRAFTGPVLSIGGTTDAELLTYSLVWLVYAWLLFGLALKTGFASLRYAALAVLAVATAKVLLVDWGALDGLQRFAAFAALGFSLLGIPFLYQKLVFPPSPGDAPEEAARPNDAST